MQRVVTVCCILAGFPSCQCAEQEIPAQAIWLDIDVAEPRAEVDERFLSYALDTNKVVYQDFDFSRERLLTLTRQLSPALLRIGGTSADLVYYDLSATPVEQPPSGYTGVLDRSTWAAACGFASALGVEIMFTLNAGVGPRAETGQWRDEQARQLMQASVAQGCPVRVWELGNEVDVFAYEHGYALSPEQYAQDFEVFADLRDELDPESRTAGPASLYWPTFGELLNPIIPGLLLRAGPRLDILTWHYYPQQSHSCKFTKPREIDAPLMPMAWLDEIETWAAQVQIYRDAFAPQAEVWLGETGHALCGGEPGISDTFASSFWWLDELGREARRGQSIVVRQALSGGAYHLLADSDLRPTPDYYASLLWKRHMGTKVLDATLDESPESLRAYAHCDVDGGGSVVALIINFDPTTARDVALLDGDVDYEAQLVTAADLSAEYIHVNGYLWIADDDGNAPTPEPVSGHGFLQLPPLSYAFVRMPGADADACM